MFATVSEKFQNQFQNLSAVLSILTNSFLIFLIIKKSPAKLGAYKNLMIFISVFEVFYSIVDAIAKPFIFSYGTSFLVIVNMENSFFDPFMSLVMNAVYCGCFGFSLAIFGIHFIYRYLVATGNKLLRTFKSWKILLWMSIPFVYAIVWGCISFFLVRQDEITDKHIKNALLEYMNLKIENIVYLGPSFYFKNANGETELVMRHVYAMLILTTELISSLFTAFFFGILCYRKIYKLAQKSTSSMRFSGLQSQLFFALVTQALIPVALMHIPVLIMFITTFIGKELGTAIAIVSVSIALYPVIDPLPTIFIIKYYRKACYEYYYTILMFFKGKFGKTPNGRPQNIYQQSQSTIS